jgi:hypothetical protein
MTKLHICIIKLNYEYDVNIVCHFVVNIFNSELHYLIPSYHDINVSKLEG